MAAGYVSAYTHHCIYEQCLPAVHIPSEAPPSGATLHDRATTSLLLERPLSVDAYSKEPMTEFTLTCKELERRHEAHGLLHLRLQLVYARHSGHTPAHQHMRYNVTVDKWQLTNKPWSRVTDTEVEGVRKRDLVPSVERQLIYICIYIYTYVYMVRAPPASHTLQLAIDSFFVSVQHVGHLHRLL